MTDEEDELIEVTSESYKIYLFRYLGGLKLVCNTVVFMALAMAAMLSTEYFIGMWAMSEHQKEDFGFYCPLILFLVLLQVIFIVAENLPLRLMSWSGAKKLHNEMIESVTDAPINLYFDTTPIGRILNRFSNDLSHLEEGMGWILESIILNFFEMACVCIVAFVAMPSLLCVSPLMIWLCYKLLEHGLTAIKEVTRVNQAAYSVPLSHLTETISGAATIRAYKNKERFISEYYRLANKVVYATAIESAVHNWFSLRAEAIGGILMIFLSAACVLIRDRADPILLSMMLT